MNVKIARCAGAAVLFWLSAAVARADDLAALPEHYRDVKVYCTSAPDPKDAGVIVATLWLENHGRKPLDLAVALGANDKLGFAGLPNFTATLKPGGEAKTTLPFKPAEGLKREVLQGSIKFGGAIDRDLFIAVQGPDAPDFKDKNVENITAKAQVVATYAPRTLESIRRSMDPAIENPPTLEGTRRGFIADAIAKKKVITIASNGQSKHSIVVELMPPKTADGKPMTLDAWAAAPGLKPAELELIAAVRDLQRCIEVQSGAKLPIVADSETPAIRIRALLTPAIRTSHQEGYSLVSTPAGDVSIRSFCLEGSTQGIYALLTDYLDCHWFLPKKLGEEIVVPADKTVRLPVDLVEGAPPSWFSTNGMSWSAAPEWDRRNRSMTNRGRMNFGHSWANYITPAEFPYDKFPEMWARDKAGKVKVFDKGWTSTNFCSTNPKVIDIVAAKINAIFKANPEAIVASIDPNDLAPFCECETCTALDKQYGIEHQDGEHMADRLLHFSKLIYDKLDPAYKEKNLGILAYGHQTNPPVSAKAHPHHAATLCDFPPYFDHSRPFNDPTSPKNVQFYNTAKAWGAALKGGNFGFYDYYGQYAFFGPWGIIHKMREDLPAFRELGGTFLVIEAQPNFAANGLNLYVASRLAWDVHADVDVLMEEYFSKFYGPAADAMRSYWLTAEKEYALSRPGTRVAQRIGKNEALWVEFDGYLKEAERVTANAEPRFRDRIKFVRDGFDYGRKADTIERTLMPRMGAPGDLPGAIAALKGSAAELERMKKTYTPESDYWPIMMPAYFYPALEPMIKAMEEAQQDPEKRKNLADTLEKLMP